MSNCHNEHNHCCGGHSEHDRFKPIYDGCGCNEHNFGCPDLFPGDSCDPNATPHLDLEYYKSLVLKTYRVLINLAERVNVVESSGILVDTIDKKLDINSTRPVENRAIAQEFVNVDDNINGVKDSVSSTRDEIVKVNTEVNKLSADLAAMGVNNAGLSERILELAQKILNLTKDVEDLPGKIPDTKSAFRQVYIQSPTKPNTPSGGSYDFTTQEFVPPTGWNNSSNFMGTETIWFSYCTFFSDGTKTVWSDPSRYVNTSKLLTEIDGMCKDYYDKMLEDASSELNQILEEAKSKLQQANNEIAEANKLIGDAHKTIENAERVLAEIEEAFGDSGVQETIGKLDLFAKWYDKDAGRINEIFTTYDAIRGRLDTVVETVNTVDKTVTQLGGRIDSVDATMTQFGKRIDDINKTVTQYENKVDLQNASITTTLQKVSTLEGTVNTYKETIDAANAKADRSLESVSTLDGKVGTFKESIDAANGKAETAVTKANELTGEVVKVSTKLDAEAAAWRAAVSQLDPDGNVGTGTFELTPNMIRLALAKSLEDGDGDKAIGATIAAMINGTESSVIIDADKINLTGEVLARLLKTSELQIGTDSIAIHLKPDGSGYLANENISWDKDGHITLGDNLLTINPDGSIAQSGLSDFPIGTVLTSTEVQNPFGANYEKIGSHYVGDQMVFDYEKKYGGKDPWMDGDTFKPDYDKIDELGVCMIDKFGAVYETKQEWIDGGRIELCGVAIADEFKHRFCMALTDTMSGKMFNYDMPTGYLTEEQRQEILSVIKNRCDNPDSYFYGKRDTIQIYNIKPDATTGAIKNIFDYTFPNGKVGYLWSTGEAKIFAMNYEKVHNLLANFGYSQVIDNSLSYPDLLTSSFTAASQDCSIYALTLKHVGSEQSGIFTFRDFRSSYAVYVQNANMGFYRPICSI